MKETDSKRPSRTPLGGSLSTCAGGWSEFIEREEMASSGLKDAERHSRLAAAYLKATNSIGYSRTAEAGRIWLKHAMHEAKMSPEEGREIFKCMKRNGIGADDTAFYVGWSSLEASQGHIDKACDILAKGIERATRDDALQRSENFCKIDQTVLGAELESLRAQEGREEVSHVNTSPEGGNQRRAARSRPNSSRPMPSMLPRMELPDRTMLSLPKPPTSSSKELEDTVVLPLTAPLKPQPATVPERSNAFEGTVDAAAHQRMNQVLPTCNTERPRLGAVNESKPESGGDSGDTIRLSQRGLGAGRKAAGGKATDAPRKLGLTRLGSVLSGPARRVTPAGDEQLEAVGDGGSLSAETLESVLEDTLMCAELQCTAHLEDKPSDAPSLRLDRVSISSSRASVASTPAAIEPKSSQPVCAHTPQSSTPRSPSLPTASHGVTPNWHAPSDGLCTPRAACTNSIPPTSSATQEQQGGAAVTPRVGPTPTVQMRPMAALTPVGCGCSGGGVGSAGRGRERESLSVNGVIYTKLELLGRGGTSQVFRVLSPEGRILALKQV